MRRELSEMKEMLARTILIGGYHTALPERVGYREEDGFSRPTLEEVERDQIRRPLSWVAR